MTVRTAERLAYCRAVASDQDVLDRYFALREQMLYDNKIINCPNRIFNCDKTGFPLLHKPQIANILMLLQQVIRHSSVSWLA